MLSDVGRETGSLLSSRIVAILNFFVVFPLSRTLFAALTRSEFTKWSTSPYHSARNISVHTQRTVWTLSSPSLSKCAISQLLSATSCDSKSWETMTSSRFRLSWAKSFLTARFSASSLFGEYMMSTFCLQKNSEEFEEAVSDASFKLKEHSEIPVL